jgi:hypothetical protein
VGLSLISEQTKEFFSKKPKKKTFWNRQPGLSLISKEIPKNLPTKILTRNKFWNRRRVVSPYQQRKEKFFF